MFEPFFKFKWRTSAPHQYVCVYCIPLKNENWIYTKHLLGLMRGKECKVYCNWDAVSEIFH